MSSSVKWEHYHLPCRFAVRIVLGYVLQIFGDVKAWLVMCPPFAGSPPTGLSFLVPFVNRNALTAFQTLSIILHKSLNFSVDLFYYL